MAGIVKYTEEELRGYSVAAVVPEGIDLTGFAEIVRSDKFEGEELVTRPNLRKTKHRETKQTDADGWTVTVPAPKGGRRLSGQGEEGAREQIRESKDHALKVKTNSKNISSKPADLRDAIAEKQTITFNAFDALGDEED
ncbi:unnamed protein product [Kuraishia capsulata CBS 1993]|uniref:Cap-associated protein CAF20 n=1 Tax=Kuraishia capsulata CBS 1993 TaxID=1382522 RepID=W6MQ18_9ASCO|nr:uncharacterized protein KUCA_T00004405001 [Kuraishia capsulata CBS 1993]CDK28423.1 unnamed protein product [Kuraishia capsulata CBS 1993]